MNFIGGFACSLRHWRTGLYPNPSWADSLRVGGCTHQLEFDAATSIATNGRIPISEGLQAASDSVDNEWFLGFDKNGNDA